MGEFFPLLREAYGPLVALREVKYAKETKERQEGEVLTYATLVDRITSCAQDFTSRGIGRGNRLGLVSENSIATFIQKCAAMSIGAVVVPWTESTEESGMTAEEAMERAGVEFVSYAGGEPFRIHEGEGSPRSSEEGTIGPHDLAMLMYSSGTGGKAPKLIGITHANLLYQYATAPGCLRPSPGLRYLHILPPYHIFGEVVLGAALSAGLEVTMSDIQSLGRNGRDLFQRGKFQATIAVPDVFTRVREKIEAELPKQLLGPYILRCIHDDMIRHARQDIARATAMGNPPLSVASKAYWSSLLEGAPDVSERIGPLQRFFRHCLYRMVLRKVGLDHMEYAISGGSALPAGTRAFFHALGQPGVRIISGYGMTETSGICSIPNPDGTDPAATAGEVIPGTVVWTEVGDHGLPEIRVAGPGVARYMDLPTQEELIPDGVLHTGDIGAVYEGMRNSRGEIATLLRLSGRVKRMIKWRGQSLLPEPMELLLQESPLIEEALIVGDEEEGRLGALVTLATDMRALAEDSHDFNHPEVRRHIEGEIRRLTARKVTKQRATLDSFWIVERFPDQFRTLSRKLKPPLILEYLRDQIREMWEGGKLLPLPSGEAPAR